MPSRMVDTLCRLCGAPRRCRVHLVDHHTLCADCGRGVAARRRGEGKRVKPAVAASGRRKTALPKTSAFKGVHWDDERQMWAACINVGGRQVYLGRWGAQYEAEAAAAFERAAESLS